MKAALVESDSLDFMVFYALIEKWAFIDLIYYKIRSQTGKLLE